MRIFIFISIVFAIVKAFKVISVNFKRPNRDFRISLQDESISSSLAEASARSPKLSVFEIFRSLCSSKNFIDEYWQKQPLYVSDELINVKGSFVMEDVKSAVDNEFLEAGRGTFIGGKTGWKMASVSQPRGSTFQEAKLQFNDVSNALKEKSG